MFSSLLITLREGLEAALILAIIISFLGRTGEGSRRRYVWLGAAGAAALSAVAGAALFAAGGSLPEEAAEVFEVAATFSAAILLTYMIVWMRNNGGGIKAGLESRVGARAASPAALALLSFTAVGREGLETALFLFASAASASAAVTLTGGLAGLGLAAIAGAALYRGSLRLDLKVFFNVTGVLLILFAAGLISHSIHEVEEMGAVAAPLSEPLWDTGALLGHEEGPGAVLKSLFGYRSDPSLLQVLAYWSYLLMMAGLFFRPGLSRLAGAREGSA